MVSFLFRDDMVFTHRAMVVIFQDASFANATVVCAL